MKSILPYSDIKNHLTHNEEKFVVAERFIITLQNAIYNHMTALLKNMVILD